MLRGRSARPRARRPAATCAAQHRGLTGGHIRHLRGERVFFQRDGSAVDETTLRSWMERAQRHAGLAVNKGQIHILRHSFCSALLAQGTPPTEVQRYSGHKRLSTLLDIYSHFIKSEQTGSIDRLASKVLG